MEERSCTRWRRIGERRGSRAVGGCGEIEAAGKDASRGASNSSARGGRIGGCIVVLMRPYVGDHMQMQAFVYGLSRTVTGGEGRLQDSSGVRYGVTAAMVATR